MTDGASEINRNDSWWAIEIFTKSIKSNEDMKLNVKMEPNGTAERLRCVFGYDCSSKKRYIEIYNNSCSPNRYDHLSHKFVFNNGVLTIYDSNISVDEPVLSLMK